MKNVKNWNGRIRKSIYFSTDGRGDRPAFSFAVQRAGSGTFVHGDGKREGDTV